MISSCMKLSGAESDRIDTPAHQDGLHLLHAKDETSTFQKAGLALPQTSAVPRALIFFLSLNVNKLQSGVKYGLRSD